MELFCPQLGSLSGDGHIVRFFLLSLSPTLGLFERRWLHSPHFLCLSPTFALFMMRRFLGVDQSSGTPPSPHTGLRPLEYGGREGRAEWDLVSSVLALPWGRGGCPPHCVVLPDEEDRVSLRANKPASALKNTGWLRCCGAAGTAVEGEDEGVEEEEEELATPLGRASCRLRGQRGQLGATGGRRPRYAGKDIRQRGCCAPCCRQGDSPAAR